MGSGYQCFPQWNLHRGPHFPPKRHKNFKEFMRMLSLSGKWASWSAMLPQSLADARRHGVACFLVPLPSTILLSIRSARDTAATPPPSPIRPDTPISLGKEPSPHCVNRPGIWGLQLEILRPRWPFPSAPIYLVGLLIWDICFRARLPHYKANSLQQIFCPQLLAFLITWCLKEWTI